MTGVHEGRQALLAWIGGAPPPDPARVIVIREAIDLADPAIPATLGERARLEVLNLIERLLSEIRTSDLGECSNLLGHLRDRLTDLDPRRLEPRRGMARWFDSRGRRLKAFRAAFAAAVRTMTDSAGEALDRAASIDRRGRALETLWAETRSAVSELDAYIAAGMARLAEAAPAVTIAVPPADAEPEAVENTPGLEPFPEPEPATASPREALMNRLALLVATRNAAVRQLPLVRLAQNADCRTPGHIRAATDGLGRWRDDWRDGLGLNARRPRRIKPDQMGLARERDALTAVLAAAERQLAAARQRRAEAETRMARVAGSVRRG